MRRLGLAATQLQQAAHSAPDRLPQAVLAASSLLWSAALGNQQVRGLNRDAAAAATAVGL